MKKKVYYCPRCESAFIKTRYESDRCEYCGKSCVIMKVWYSGFNIAAIAVMSIVAVVLYLHQEWDIIYRIGLLVVGFVIAFLLSTVGLERMKEKAIKIAKRKTN